VNCENGTKTSGRPCPNRARWLIGGTQKKKVCPVHLSPALENVWREKVGPDPLAKVELPVRRLP
jgi:hypothetical protein